jgi:hypothetical protein
MGFLAVVDYSPVNSSSPAATRSVVTFLSFGDLIHKDSSEVKDVGRAL